jgi:hypothetical protein
MDSLKLFAHCAAALCILFSTETFAYSTTNQFWKFLSVGFENPAMLPILKANGT